MAVLGKQGCAPPPPRALIWSFDAQKAAGNLLSTGKAEDAQASLTIAAGTSCTSPAWEGGLGLGCSHSTHRHLRGNGLGPMLHQLPQSSA